MSLISVLFTQNNKKEKKPEKENERKERKQRESPGNAMPTYFISSFYFINVILDFSQTKGERKGKTEKYLIMFEKGMYTT